MTNVQSPLSLYSSSPEYFASQLTYPESMLVLGRSATGPSFEIVRITSLAEADQFGEGDLVEALRLAWEAGKRTAFAMRLHDEEIESSALEEKEKLQLLLERAYRQLKGFPVHVLVPCGISMNDEALVDSLAEFVGSTNSSVRSTMAVVSAPAIDVEDSAASLDSILTSKDFKSQRKRLHGVPIVAVASPLVVGGRLVDPAPYYGALLSQTPSGISPTGILAPRAALPYRLREGVMEESIVFGEDEVSLKRRPLALLEASQGFESGVDFFIDYEEASIKRLPDGKIAPNESLMLKYRYSDLDSLAAAGITAFKERPYRGLYVGTAVTVSAYPFRLQSTVRGLQDIAARIELIAESYIGRSISSRGAQAALESDINNALSEAVAQRVIRYFEETLDWHSVDEADVFLSIGLWDEVQDITIRIPVASK